MSFIAETLGDLVIFGAVVVSTLFCLVLLTAPSQYDHSPEILGEERKDRKVSVQVLVLGDIGRSPRMQYHAISIAKHGGHVDLIGYQESELHPDIVENPLINVVPIAPLPEWLRTNSKLMFLLLAPLKVLWQTYRVYHALGYRTQPARWMLVQVICFIRNTALVIDWHNFGYSILALKLGQKHPLVKVSEWYESFFSQTASTHFAVTNAMARKLKNDYGITALPLHDRPATIFKPLTKEERSSFLANLPEIAQYAKDIAAGRWKLIVSSTSWTADEDFSILLDALVGYSARATSRTELPKIIAIITGKGPQKEYYLSKLRTLNQEKKLLNVIVLTAWLTPEDYASLLGAADLGVSLHTSSSGVDLPMKVVDMFGAGLPVVGWSDFEAWSELVKEGTNGKGFNSAKKLEDLFVALFHGTGDSLRTLKEGALLESKRRWDGEWDPVAGKLFRLVE